MNDNELHPDEIAAYKYSKNVQMVEKRIINAFMDGCEHKDKEPIVKRLESVLVSVTKEMQLHGRRADPREVNSKKEKEIHAFLIDMKDKLHLVHEMMKLYKEEAS